MSSNISKNMKITGFSGNFAGIGGSSCLGGSGSIVSTIGRVSGKGASSAAAMHLALHSTESDMLAISGGVCGAGYGVGVGISGTGGNIVIIPLIRCKDNAKQLPTYNSAMLRSPDDHLAAEDLDSIQLELETLLSSVAMRARVLKTEYDNIDKDEKRNDRRNKEKQPLSPAPGYLTNGVGCIGGSSSSSNHLSASSSLNGKRKRDDPVAVRKKHSSMTILKQAHHHHHQSKLTKNSSLGIGMLTDDSMDFLTMPTPTFGASGSSTVTNNHSHTNSHSHSHTHANHRNDHHQLPKISMPKNDMPNKFWLSVEPYCMPLSQEDVRLIDDLLEQYKGPLVPPIPPLGPHYSVSWAAEDMKNLQESPVTGSSNRNSKGTTSATATTSKLGSMVKKADAMMDECITGPLTQRLVSALVEEQMVSHPSEQAAVGEHSSSSSSDHTHSTASAANMPYSNFRSLSMLKNCVGIEQRVKKELMEQGILDMGDFPNNDDDEVLLQIKSLSAEINSVANYNRAELTQLQTTANNEIKRIELKRKLDVVDQEILESYKRMLQYRAKRRGFSFEEQKEIYRLTSEQRALAEQLERLKMQSQPI